MGKFITVDIDELKKTVKGLMLYASTNAEPAAEKINEVVDKLAGATKTGVNKVAEKISGTTPAKESSEESEETCDCSCDCCCNKCFEDTDCDKPDTVRVSVGDVGELITVILDRNKKYYDDKNAAVTSIKLDISLIDGDDAEPDCTSYDVSIKMSDTVTVGSSGLIGTKA